jgi:hypothetical protein
VTARKSVRAAKGREKKSFDLSKLHLTPSPGKFNSWSVSKAHFDDFAQSVRTDEGVILHGN